MGNPRVYFDITVDGSNAGRIVMECSALAPCLNEHTDATKAICIGKGYNKTFTLKLTVCIGLRLWCG
uniref:Uncharacterized protein n=1 Tax=Periophthalmus magnuspinnatus TaxID=409849 RepID=A0A3B4AY90_9GOBI